MIKETRVENGALKGIAAADPRIISYKGIPYAAPPVGDLRWHAPTPCADWEGVLDCSRFAPISMQGIPGAQNNIYSMEWNVDQEIVMDEDCLKLNIWTPAKDTSDRLPVFVWYFGGGYQEGNTAEMEFNGERIARRGIVVVTINYRVNNFGFLSHPEITAENPDAPANFGLLDQRFGTQWVKRNITAFGGDPDNITIGGQSAGGGSVIYHLTAPGNDGLFQKAIIMSGAFDGNYRPMLSGKHTLAENEALGVKFFDFLGVKTLAEARKLDAFYIRDKYAEFIGGKFDTSSKTGAAKGEVIGPVIDGKYVLDESFKLMHENKRYQVPVIMGNTRDEFPAIPLFETREEFDAYVSEKYGDKLSEFMAFADGADYEAVKKNASFNAAELGTRCVLEAEKGKTEAPMWYYQFDPEIPGFDDPGAFHSSDLWFFFETLACCWRPFTGKHYDLARKMCNYWAEFIKKGDPNGNDADGTPMPYWKSYGESGAPIFFGDDVEMLDGSEETEFMKWLVKFHRKDI